MSRGLLRQIRFIDQLVEQLLDERARLMHELQGGRDGEPVPRNPHLKPMGDDELMLSLVRHEQLHEKQRQIKDPKKEDDDARRQVGRQIGELRSEAMQRAFDMGVKAGVFK